MVEDQKPHISYHGDGSTTVFPIPFPYIKKEDIVCLVYDEAAETEEKLDAHVFIDDVQKAVLYPWYPPGEEVEDANRPPPLKKGKIITLVRRTALTQDDDLGTMYPLTIAEQMIDKSMLILQEHAEELSRCVKIIQSGTESPETMIRLIRESREDAAQAVGKAMVAAEKAENASEKVEGAANTAAEALATAQALRDAVEGETKLIEYVKKVTDALNVAKIDFFEVDINGDIMPIEEPIYDVNYELDENGDIMPKE
ncbi:hypothetical protein TAMA11512_12840 [Selenomonas sp. TAMA-11512]|uniref:hypothetical protein n=1 Tax=Selenomonas sp. TAMA-11512 TaxID=3095337 RepID=UPI0030872629|nr:hypothetical protein TAMA11512_12840 [Selenomonas sp. TAMA-11512]